MELPAIIHASAEPAFLTKSGSFFLERILFLTIVLSLPVDAESDRVSGKKIFEIGMFFEFNPAMFVVRDKVLEP